MKPVESLPPLLILAGPTACGKTLTAVHLAEALGSEIISADSVQVYKYFDIGSAKPSPSILAMVPHHLISVAEPEEEYNVARFRGESDAVARKLIASGKIPIVAGGTGLYIKALTEGFHCGAKISAEAELRMDEIEARDGLEGLHRLAVEADPEWMTKVHPNDRFRVRRAVGVFWTEGRRLSEIYRQNPPAKAWDTLTLVMDIPRETLFRRIESRVDEMFREGWLEEVKHLREKGYNTSVKPMRSLGYRTLYDQLEGAALSGPAPEIIKKETRAYAKRQTTWFRRVEGAVYVSAGGADSPESISQTILARDDVRKFLDRHSHTAGQ
ncbi:MAG: tRNA (adenosine(37)-N6)-dimethylallyltransferase MiaA [Nitrospinae bacterium]|nr:tRNA (adenosine(37)-N6)-dimethylallyltransferase MiaA [Nitrospinota bacterium]